MEARDSLTMQNAKLRQRVDALEASDRPGLTKEVTFYSGLADRMSFFRILHCE